MIGIKEIACYIPDKRIDNIAAAKRFSVTESFIENKIGGLNLPIKDAEQETSDLAVLAIQALERKCPDMNKITIDALVVITQNPDKEGLPHTSAIVQKKMGMPTTVAAFDVSLGCSGYVHGLYIVKGFLEASGLKNAILVTADPYSKIIDYEDKVTSLLFGDAATATWIGEKPKWELRAVAYGTNGEGSEYLKVEHNKLKMNGRQVFNFALSKVALHIFEVLKKEGLDKEDIDLFCVHQGSAAIVDAIAKKFGDSAFRFVKDLEHTGNTVSSSIPLLLEKHAYNSNIEQVLISGFGVGMSWASAVIKKVKEV